MLDNCYYFDVNEELHSGQRVREKKRRNNNQPKNA